MTKDPLEKNLTLRGKPNSEVGKMITYLQERPMEARELVKQTLAARFYPFILSKDDPDFQALAIQCAEECESWARAIRQYASIPSSGASENGGQSRPSYAQNGHETDARDSSESEDEEDPDESSDNVIKRMGLDFS